MKEAIRRLGNMLPNLTCATIYLSQHLIKVYNTRVIAGLRYHHPLPPLQSSLYRVMQRLRIITHASRGLLCKSLHIENGINLHVFESTRLQSYDVNDVGLTEEEDKEVLRIALAATLMHEKVFLVTADSHFLKDLDQTKLLRKYCDKSQRIEIVTPIQFCELLNRELMRSSS
jgi:predicted nucleic acid-binding protein